MGNEQQIGVAKKSGVGEQFIRGEVPTLEKFPVRLELSCSRSTYICGVVGTGKSWLLCCLAVDALRHGGSVGFINWSRFKRRVRSSYQPSARETEIDIFNYFSIIPILCIDDLGVGTDEQGRETKAARDMIYDLIDHRYWRKMPVHITSNMEPGKLITAYDKRIARRINEMCQVVMLTETVGGKAGER